MGYTETVTATYLDLSFKATARYVRFSGLKCKAEQGQDVPVTLSEVEVNPETEQDQGRPRPWLRFHSTIPDGRR